MGPGLVRLIYGLFMAIFGRLEDIKLQFSNFDKLNIVFQYLNRVRKVDSEDRLRIMSMRCDQYEKIQITNDIFAIEQSYETRKPEESLFESHIKYVDFQFMISGEEIIEVTHTDLLEVDSEYSEEGDYRLYRAGPGSSKIIIQADDLSIFFPKDGHMSGVQTNKASQQVFKTVVKIPLLMLSFYSL